MNPTKKLFVAVLLLIIATIFTTSLLIKKNSALTDNNNRTDFVLYYGITCPNCKTVEEYIKNNNLAAKMGIGQKEVFQNQINQQDMAKTLQGCGLDSAKLYVPMLWDSKTNKCYGGQEDKGANEIIDFLKQRAGQ